MFLDCCCVIALFSAVGISISLQDSCTSVLNVSEEKRSLIHRFSGTWLEKRCRVYSSYRKNRPRENKGVLYIALAVCQNRFLLQFALRARRAPSTDSSLCSGFYEQFWSTSVCAVVNEVNLSILIIYLTQSGSSCNTWSFLYE